MCVRRESQTVTLLQTKAALKLLGYRFCTPMISKNPVVETGFSNKKFVVFILYRACYDRNSIFHIKIKVFNVSIYIGININHKSKFLRYLEK